MGKLLADTTPPNELQQEENLIPLVGSSKTTLISSGLFSNRINFEQALELCGGFGWFQTFVTFVIAMGFFTGGQLVNGIGFLTALPNQGRGYLCLDLQTQKWS